MSLYVYIFACGFLSPYIFIFSVSEISKQWETETETEIEKNENAHTHANSTKIQSDRQGFAKRIICSIFIVSVENLFEFNIVTLHDITIHEVFPLPFILHRFSFQGIFRYELPFWVSHKIFLPKPFKSCCYVYLCVFPKRLNSQNQKFSEKKKHHNNFDPTGIFMSWGC